MRRQGIGGEPGWHERGQVIVMFALLLPVFFGLGSIVMSVGQWYVHKRHLQTLVDAGAFAGGTSFNACYLDPISTNNVIADRALEYAGDPNRAPATRNAQVQEQGDIHVLLNSDRYWALGDPTDDATLRGTLDNTLGLPCDTKFLDVKATDDRVPLLWRWIPLFPSPKARARVEIRQVQGLNGTMPWAVPEQDPAVVAALIINEDQAATSTASVVSAVPLVKQTNLPANDPLRQWSTWRGDALDIGLSNGSNFGVVILTSRDPSASLSGSLDAICRQNLVQTRCYAGGTNSSSLSFIRAYSPGTPAVAVRDVQLINANCSNDLSAPYFLLNGGCSVQMHAVVDFGVSGDPQGMPTCGSVSGMTWSAGGIGGPLGTWTRTIGLTAGSGRNPLGITATYRDPTRSNCSQPLSFTESKVAAPYVANDASGPVEYLEVRNLTTGTLGNSLPKASSGINLRFTVGLVPPLVVAQAWNEPPVYLRVTSNSSQTQAVDCDGNNISGPSGNHSNFRNEIQDGCYVWYQMNNRNGDCTGYSTGNLPPTQVVNTPYPDCVVTQTGVSSGQIRQALQTRFGGNPCKTLNNWPAAAGDPFPDAADPRYVILFIVDTGNFSGSGNEIFPVRKFGGFYLTGGDGLGCPGDDPPPPGTRQASAWGHFVAIEAVNPDAQPSEQLCAFDQVGVCLAVLVD